MRVGRHCVVCGSSEKENTETLFSFPKNPEHNEQWRKRLKISGNVKTTGKVCQLHFPKDQFVRDRLKKGALPSYSDQKHKCLTNLAAIKPLLAQNGDNSRLEPCLASNQLNTRSTCEKETQCTMPYKRRFSNENNLKKKLKRLGDKSDRLVDLDKAFGANSSFTELIKGQVLRFKFKKKPYTKSEKSTAVSLYYSCGKQGYRTLQRVGMKLPSLRTVRRWMSAFSFGTGISSHLFQALARIVSTMSVQEKDCVIVWDEMSTKEFIQYNKVSDSFEGIVDVGRLGRRFEAATEVLVFMVQGINYNWRFPISYYFSRNNTTAELLQEIITENIQALQNVGLRVRLGICDMAFTNQAVYRHWNVTPDSPFRQFGEEKVYFAHDTPHLVKLIRNNLLKHNFETTRITGRKIFKERIKWLHIRAFYTKDTRLTTRMAPRLTTQHLYLKDYSKMKVKLATQLLSHSVYAGMMSMINLKILKQDALPTARFIKMVDGMFDLLNISKFSRDKPGRRAVEYFNDMEKLNLYAEFLKTVHVCKSERRADFLKGLDLTLKSIYLLSKDLRNEGYQFLYTRNLQQDCLENFFSAIRQKGGFCRNPTTVQFKNSFKCLFFVKFVKTPSTGNSDTNCTKLFEGLQRLNGELILLKADENTTDTDERKNAPPNPSSFFNLKAKRKLILGMEQLRSAADYFGAAVVSTVTRKNNCKNCKKMLVTNPRVSGTKTLNDFKREGRRLTSLEHKTREMFLFIDANFEKTMIDTLQQDGQQIIDNMLSSLLRNPPVYAWAKSECNLHRVLIIKYYLCCKLHRLAKDKNDTIRKIKSWAQSRRDLRNQ